MKKNLYLFLLAVTVIASACRKNNQTPTIDMVKDSVYLYAKEEYLWYDALPDYNAFNPRSFSGQSDLSALQGEVDAISQFKINPATNFPYEYVVTSPGHAKYSFIDQGETSQVLSGNNGDFGFYPVFTKLSSTDLRVRYVNPGSPAAAAGLHRGDLILSIVNVPGLDVNNNTDLNAITAALSARTIGMTLKRANGTTYSVNIASAGYTANPVMKDTVYNTSNGKKVGYLVFSVFTDTTNAKPKLDAAFDYFINQGITDLVVDLRYNGGGYVATAEYLDNLIVPPAKSGTKMYASFYNNKLQAGQHPLLSTQFDIRPGEFSTAANTVRFSKKKSLNLSSNQVTFIVTNRTASASELTINNLRPQMDVKLIGSTSYGKPVGFFNIPVNRYQLYLSEFETKNAADQGGYYAGMTPGSADYPGYLTADDVTKDFGDPTESLLSHALSYINTGTYAIAGPKVESIAATTLSVQQQNNLDSKLNDHAFNGMIFNTRMKRKGR